MTDASPAAELPAHRPIAAARIALIVVLVIRAFFPILIKLSEDEIAPSAIIFDQNWMTLFVLVLWFGTQSILSQQKNGSIVFSSFKTAFQLNWTVLLILVMGFLGCFNQLLWAWSLTHTNVANSAIAFSLTPLFSTLGEWLIFARRFSWQFMVGLLIAMFGALAIGLKDLNLNLEYLQGDSIALVGTILYSAYLLCIEKLRAQFDSNVIFFWRCLVSSILMLPIVLVIQAQLFPESPLGFIFLISLVCSSSLSQLLVVYILKTLSAGLIALAMLIDPILTAILAGLLFAEQLSIESWLLFSVVLFGIYLAIINQPEAPSDLA